MSKHYGPWSGGPLARALATEPGKVASHWLVQSLFYMDPTERRFKLAVDGVLASIIFAGARRRFSPLTSAIVALLGAHTLNFLFNGHLWGALKWHGRSSRTPAQLIGSLRDISGRLLGTPGVVDVYVYGSLNRDEIHSGSDLDIRVLRAPGAAAALLVCSAVMLERARALFAGLPLDIYVWDSAGSAASMRPDEEAVSVTTLAQGWIP